MKIFFTLFIFFISVAYSFSQNQNSVWVFGDSAGIDFSSGTPITFASGMDGRGSCASIADSNGNLIFYGYTYVTLSRTTIMNAINDTMANSDPMQGEGLYNDVVIIPKPSTQNNYFVFYIGVIGYIDTVYYAEIDMTLNGGLGGAISKNVPIGSFRPADCVQAIKHGNGRDWWIIFKYSNPNSTLINRFYVYLVTPTGISPPIIQNKGTGMDADFQKIIFNSTGTKLMLINTGGFMCEYDFNRCTGIISNPNIIYTQQTAFFNRTFWEGAYSPNDQVFYTTTLEYNNIPGYLLQFDLSAPNIALSCDTLETFQVPIGPGAVRLAPDNKIYFSRAYECNAFPYCYPYPDSVYNQYNMNLSVINYPDSLGAACDYQPFSFYLGGKRTYYGLPNNPNYSLGSLVGSPCDTLGVGISEQEINNGAELFIFYHNDWQTAFINAKRLKGKNYLLQIFDMAGREIVNEKGKLFSEYFTRNLNLVAFAKGMYLVNFVTDKERLIKKFVKD